MDMTRLNIRKRYQNTDACDGTGKLRGRNEAASSTETPGWLVLNFENILSEEEIQHGLNRDDCKGCNLVLAES